MQVARGGAEEKNLAKLCCTRHWPKTISQGSSRENKWGKYDAKEGKLEKDVFCPFSTQHARTNHAHKVQNSFEVVWVI